MGGGTAFSRKIVFAGKSIWGVSALPLSHAVSMLSKASVRGLPRRPALSVGPTPRRPAARPALLPAKACVPGILRRPLFPVDQTPRRPAGSFSIGACHSWAPSPARPLRQADAPVPAFRGVVGWRAARCFDSVARPNVFFPFFSSRQKIIIKKTKAPGAAHSPLKSPLSGNPHFGTEPF